MIVRSWAERILRAPATPDVIDLHVNDTLAAFLTGLRTKDGQAIVRRYGASVDRSEQAASVSAIARLSECDDIHLASCVTPGAVVIPVALALSADRSPEDFNRAVLAGYAVGIHLGTAIGGARALSRGIWPTLFAAPVMAAVTASILADDEPERLAHAMALGLANASGRVTNPADRWTMLADAVLRGIHAAEAAHRGERGDFDRMPADVDADALTAEASIATVGFKSFPIARQGANAVVAFQRLLSTGLDPSRIDAIDVFVPAINVALLNRAPSDRLSRLCNLGLQLAAAAIAPNRLYDPERNASAELMAFARRVTVMAGNDLEPHWPDRWAARVVVHTGAERLEETVIQAPFDHDAPGLEHLLQQKWRRMLPPQDLTVLNHEQPVARGYATLWDQLERRVGTATEE